MTDAAASCSTNNSAAQQRNEALAWAALRKLALIVKRLLASDFERRLRGPRLSQRIASVIAGFALLSVASAARYRIVVAMPLVRRLVLLAQRHACSPPTAWVAP